MTPATLRLGIVDIGSNAIRLLVAEVGSEGRHVVLERTREPVRMGRDVFRTGSIAEDTVTAAIAALQRFRAACDRHAVSRVRVVATAALREADNRDAIRQLFRDDAGLDLELLSGEEEARLLVLAVQARVDLEEGRSLLVDLGGGSVEIVWVDGGRVETILSHRHGVFRLLPELTDPGLRGADLLDRLRRHFLAFEQELNDRFRGPGPDRYVAVGGHIDALADLVAGPAGSDDPVVTLPLADLRRAVFDLAAMSHGERMARGLPADRADTIVPAGWVYLLLGDRAGTEQVLVPHVGLREALLLETAARWAGRMPPF